MFSLLISLSSVGAWLVVDWPLMRTSIPRSLSESLNCASIGFAKSNMIWKKKKSMLRTNDGADWCARCESYLWTLEAALIVFRSVDIADRVIQNAFRAVIASAERNVVQCFRISRNHLQPCASTVGHNIDSRGRFMIAGRFNRKVNTLNALRLR